MITIAIDYDELMQAKHGADYKLEDLRPEEIFPEVESDSEALVTIGSNDTDSVASTDPVVPADPEVPTDPIASTDTTPQTSQDEPTGQDSETSA